MIKITKESAGNHFSMVRVVEGRTVQTLKSGQGSGGLKDDAEKQMIEEAVKIGADAIVCVCYSSVPAGNGATVVTAYGTAVKYTPSS